MSQAEYNLGKHCGITFAKLKPASLYTIKEDEREIFIHFLEKFRAKGFEYKFMRVAKGRFLVYVYNRSCLEKILFDERNRRFLQERGYNYKTLTQSVELMRERLQEEDFPHEIGVFLGYPLEDVRGFIEKTYRTHRIVRLLESIFKRMRKTKDFRQIQKVHKLYLQQNYCGSIYYKNISSRIKNRRINNEKHNSLLVRNRQYRSYGTSGL